MNLTFFRFPAFILVASLFTSSARAMTIHDFGRMDNDDEASFVALLVVSSRDYLKTHGQADQGEKLMALFKTPGHDGGTYKLADQLKQVDATNKHNAINPNNRQRELTVEDGMEQMLKDEGFKVPAAYLLTVTKTFKPQGLPRPHTLGP